MPADNGNDDVCVFLDVFPGAVAVGFVADFENHVRNVCVFLGHHVEEVDGFGKVIVRIVVDEDMPVYHHVHVVSDGVFDALPQNFEILFAVAVHIVVGIHGETDQVGVPLPAQLPEKIVVHVLRKPGEAVGASSFQYDLVSPLVEESGALYMEFSVYGGACNHGAG